jgi:hypothetical protein
MQRPGDMDTKNHVGIKISKIEKSGISGVFSAKAVNLIIRISNVSFNVR